MKRPMPVPTSPPPAKRAAAEAGPSAAAPAAVRPAPQAAGHDEPPGSPAFRWGHRPFKLGKRQKQEGVDVLPAPRLPENGNHGLSCTTTPQSLNPQP